VKFGTGRVSFSYISLIITLNLSKSISLQAVLSFLVKLIAYEFESKTRVAVVFVY
jgi:hypothetical protein